MRTLTSCPAASASQMVHAQSRALTREPHALRRDVKLNVVYFERLAMTTILDKELKRQITVEGTAYTVIIDPHGMRLVGKGRRRPEAQLRWIDLLNGEAALAVALRASLSNVPRAPKPPRPAKAAEEVGPAAKKRR